MQDLTLSRRKLRVLFVEDSEDDAKLAVRALARGGFSISHERVETLQALEGALAAGGWDAVLSDYTLPGFTGLDALAVFKAAAQDIPFILLSGTVGEELAAQAMKAGVSDYVMKRSLERLAPVLRRELAETANRAARREAERDLARSEARLRTIIETEPECVKVVSREGRLLEMNPAGLAMLEAATLAEVQARPLLDYIVAEHREAFIALHQRVMAGEQGRLEFEVAGLQGGRRWLETLATPLREDGAVSALLGITRDVTEQRRAEQTLRESEERFRSLTELSADWYWEQNEHFRFVATAQSERPEQADDLGLTRWEMAGASLADPRWTAHGETLRRHLPFREFEYSRPSRDGKLRHVSVSGMPLFDAGGRFKGYRGVGRDVTERHAAEMRIRALNRVYAVLSGINALIVRAQDRDELFREVCRIAVQDAGFRMAWIGVVDRAAGKVVPLAWDGTGPDYIELMPLGLDVGATAAYGLAGRAVKEGRAMVSNDMALDPRVLLGRESGERRAFSLAMLPIMRGGEALGMLALYASERGFFDAAELRLLEQLAADIAFALDHIEKSEKMAYLAYHDSLTGLPNRALFHERLAQQVVTAKAEGRRLALVILNLERFKTVNDSFGRQGGDALLVEVAARMRRCIPDADARVARVGADQFAVVVPDLESAEALARSHEAWLGELFGVPVALAGVELRVSARAGIAVYPEDGADADTLFNNAEAAFKNAKERGERYLFFEQRMTERVAEKLALESRLRAALERDEFVLHYQPQVDLQSGAIVGVEALIRWRSAEGLVPPAQFVPLLEETGLILEVGAWALRRAALDHRAWHERGLRPPRVSVNVSPLQLGRRDFAASVEQALLEGIAPTGIDIEITESVLMGDVEGNIAKLKALRALGVRLSIDDFGTGHSSLGYLGRLPVQALKIDRSFVAGVESDADAATLVSTIISLAHSLRLRVVAEGIETEGQARFLRLMRCDEGQGYLFARPMPAGELAALLGKGVS